MTPGIILLTLAYVAAAVLLLVMNLATRYALWIKVSAIFVVTGLYAATWLGYQQLTGWPTDQPMPDKFRVLWVNIDERENAEDTPSSIFYWLRSLDEAGLPIGPPRAFRRPWSEAAAENAEAAITALEGGEELNGSLSRTLMQNDDDSTDLDEYAGERSVSQASDGLVQIIFSIPPARQLPPKGPPG